LCNIIHLSAVFRAAFEDTFGTGKSILSSDDTRWNSAYRQIEAVVELDQVKLSNVLNQTSHPNLMLIAKEVAQLLEMISILSPFTEATDITQADKMVTISCVVTTILSLRRFLIVQKNTVTHHRPADVELLSQIDQRFYDLLDRLHIRSTQVRTSKTLAFDDDIFMKAAALDPCYAFHWLVDHPGSADDKNALCLEIIGQPSSLFIVLVVCKNTYVKVTQVPLNYVCHQLFSVSFVELVLAAAVHLWVVVYVYRCAYFVVCVFMFRSAKLQTDLVASRPGPSQDRPPVETQPTSSATSAPPQKKMRMSLFGHYTNPSQDSPRTELQQEKQLQLYIEHINSPMSTSTSLSEVFNKSEFSLLCKFFERMFCSPASSASVERAFSQSGLLLRPHRSRMTDGLLESLVYLKCN